MYALLLQVTPLVWQTRCLAKLARNLGGDGEAGGIVRTAQLTCRPPSDAAGGGVAQQDKCNSSGTPQCSTCL